MKDFRHILPFLAALLILTSCEKSQGKLCKNLLDGGVANEELLQGSWDLQQQAHTTNGKKFNQITDVGHDEYHFRVSFKDGEMTGHIINTFGGNYSLINENEIDINFHSHTMINTRDPEPKLSDAINNAICFAIIDQKLYVHHGSDKKKNILIFERS
ncbi:MAG: hypothetical protein WEC59_03385 [Salibacteraceae bacterium]